VAYFIDGGYLKIADFSGSGDAVELGRTLVPGRPRVITISGDHVFTLNEEGGLRAYVISDPTAPEQTDSESFSGLGYRATMVVYENHAYLSANGGMCAVDVSNPSDLSREGCLDVSSPDDIYVKDSFAYAVDSGGNLTVVDVSDPANPQEVSTLSFSGGARSGGAASVTVNGDYAYATDGDYSTLEYDTGITSGVIDISDPTNPQVVYTGEECYTNLISEDDLLYCGSFLGSVDVYDISDPTSLDTVQGVNAILMAAEGNRAYLSYGGEAQAFDFSDPSDPQFIGAYDPGGLKLPTVGVTVAGNYAYTASEEGGMRVVDVSTRSNPEEVGVFTEGHGRGNITYSDASVQDVVIRGSYAFLADGGDGLRVVNVTDPTDPEQVAFLDSGGLQATAQSIAVEDGYAYLADENYGLRVYDVLDPTDPEQISRLNASGNILDVAVADSLAYVTDTEVGFRIIDVSDPANPEEVSSLNADNARVVAVSEGYAYVARDYVPMKAIDVSDPTNPEQVENLGNSKEATSMAAYGNYAYAGNKNSVRVIDISDPTSLERIGSFSFPGSPNDWYVSGAEAGTEVAGGYAYVTNGQVGFSISESTGSGDIIPPDAPTGLAATVGDGQVELSWEANTGSDLGEYRLYRGTSPDPTRFVATVGAGTEGFTDTNVDESTTYYYRLTAVDDAGNESSFSEGVITAAPAAPTGLTAEATDGGLDLSFSASTEGDVAEYLIYRMPSSAGATTPFDSVDVGVTTYTDASAEAGTRYYYRVKALSESGITSAFSGLTSAFITPPEVSYDVSRSFGDAGASSNYRLVGLPGAEETALSETLDGSFGTGWKAFRQSEDGSGLAEAPDAALAPGGGVWVISKTDLTASSTTDAVEIAADGTATIDVHAGWNIISNPTDKALDWNAVREASGGASQPLWTFEGGSYAQAGTFAAAGAEGRAFYFNNAEGLEELVLPYAPDTSSSASSESAAALARGEASGDSPAWSLALTASRKAPSSRADSASETFHATVRAGVAKQAKTGFDAGDALAPPGRFEAVSLRFLPTGFEQKGVELASEYRPADAGKDGQRFQLALRSTPGRPVTLRADLPKEASAKASDRKAVLVRERTGKRFPLSEEKPVRLTPQAEEEQLTLLIGSNGFIEAAAEKATPAESKLIGTYPNPFRSEATIAYALADESDVQLTVYDMLGRKVRTLVDETQEAGRKNATLQARSLASGVYLFRLQIGDQIETGRLVHVR